MAMIPSMQCSKILFADHRLTLYMMLSVLLMLVSCILIFRMGEDSYGQALSLFPLAGAVLLLILSPLVWRYEEAALKRGEESVRPRAKKKSTPCSKRC